MNGRDPPYSNTDEQQGDDGSNEVIGQQQAEDLGELDEDLSDLGQPQMGDDGTGSVPDPTGERHGPLDLDELERAPRPDPA